MRTNFAYAATCGVLCASAALPMAALGLDHTQLAVIVNVRDPLSVAIGDYYAQRRKILFQNMIKVSFNPGEATLTRAQFDAFRKRVEQLTQPNVQAYAIAWTTPYRVECMSITSAFAFGFDPSLCAKGCKPTRINPYFASRAALPYAQLRVRPSMAIAGASFDEVKALIDRGVESDGTHPSGTAYLLSTSDSDRNVRNVFYSQVERMLQSRFRVHRVDEDVLKDKDDVMFYFTGKTYVEGLETLRFLPGAMADHLTSAGGVLDGTNQMSSLRWLEAGATASYGTVAEPCNIPDKFPDPRVAISQYLRGDTVIEAYWKSVRMPGQGIFIGEPLARPFGPTPRREH